MVGFVERPREGDCEDAGFVKRPDRGEGAPADEVLWEAGVLTPGRLKIGFGATVAGAEVEVVFTAELVDVDEGVAPKILVVVVAFAPKRPEPVFADVDVPPNNPPAG